MRSEVTLASLASQLRSRTLTQTSVRLSLGETSGARQPLNGVSMEAKWTFRF